MAEGPYNERVMDHFTNPRNMGEIEDASGVAEVGNPVCGDAMKLYLKIEDDDRCRHDFVFGSTTHRQYSDQALVLMREALASVDMDAVWAEYRRTAAMD